MRLIIIINHTFTDAEFGIFATVYLIKGLPVTCQIDAFTKKVLIDNIKLLNC